eukprot:1143204-Pelagomonas_calceolata.AAC.3
MWFAHAHCTVQAGESTSGKLRFSAFRISIYFYDALTNGAARAAESRKSVAKTAARATLACPRTSEALELMFIKRKA